MIVLDTHIALWWTQQPELLSRRATAALEHADRIIIPAIVFWETALLVRKGRFAMKRAQSVPDWAEAVLSIPRVEAADLSPEIALAADALRMHPDPADRFIVATALRLKTPLVTKDGLLQGLRGLKTIW